MSVASYLATQNSFFFEHAAWNPFRHIMDVNQYDYEPNNENLGVHISTVSPTVYRCSSVLAALDPLSYDLLREAFF